MSRTLRIQYLGAMYHSREPGVGVQRKEIFRGKRGRENEARKVAMDLVKRCCDRTLSEMAKYFGTGSYSAVSCRAIEAKMAKEKKLRNRIEKIAASIHQFHA
jgi:chromosomal replication initiation ATPase DnaA